MHMPDVIDTEEQFIQSENEQREAKVPGTINYR